MHSLAQAIKAVATSRRTPWLLLATTLAAVGLVSAWPQLRQAFVPAEVQAISARIRDRGREYVRGLELIVSGDPVLGTNLLVASTDRLGVLAKDCLRTRGCDIDVVARALGTAMEAHLERPASRPPRAAAPPVRRAAVHPAPAIAMNGPTKRALADWLTWNRPQLVAAYWNYRFLRPQLAPIYKQANLPEALLFGLLAQETGGKVHAFSSAGAAGLMQFMPITARRFGLHPVRGFDMRLDPVAATRASAAYLKALLARFDGDLPRALAAYNLGENRLAGVERSLGGRVSFWDARLSRAIPAETRLYVPGVLAAAWIFTHAADQGLATPQETGVTEITLRDPISIGELTICLGAELNPNGWFRTLRNLNPRRSGQDRIDEREPFRMPSMLVPAYVERCAGASPRLARARNLHDAHDEAPRDVAYALKAGG